MISLLLCVPGSQYSDNTPPILTLDRNWKLPETEPVGNVVIRVHAHDNEQDTLTYGLEPKHDYNGDDSPQTPLPFFIDNNTGIVYLNETLKGRVSTFNDSIQLSRSHGAILKLLLFSLVLNNQINFFSII